MADDRTIDTGTDDLQAEVRSGVGVITLNRPERRNAMSPAMIGALKAALADFESAPDVGAVVLTGAGGAFCAGGDVKGMAAAGGEGGGSPLQYDARVHRQRLDQRSTSGRLYEMPKPTIAMIPGPAAGAGLSLALACDLRYAVEGAKLTTAFAKVGFAGDYGGTWFLTRLVGSAKARELYFLSDVITAEEGERLGIVNAVFSADQLEPEVMAIAERLASGPTVAYRYMKENLIRAVHGELGECLDMEAAHHIHTGQTEDHREAAQAFVEKREPVFKGR
jgi:2-(1,2-epoxy-1,2-dihydrophenyl)acetyl-CoA isomerase